MPDLARTLLNSDPLPPIPSPKPLPDRCSPYPSMLSCSTAQTLAFDPDSPPADDDMPQSVSNREKRDVSRAKNGILKVTVAGMSCGALDRSRKSLEVQDLESHVRDWKERRIASGVPENRCFLSFLVGAKKLVECRVCLKFIYPGDGISCSVRSCQSVVYHLMCARDKYRCSSWKNFKCPQHACFLCKRKINIWRCMRCSLASNEECAPWPEEVLSVGSRTGWAVCWRHPKDWRIEKKSAAPTDNIEEIFSRLPLPYADEEFEMDPTPKESTNNNDGPPTYVHIKRSILSSAATPKERTNNNDGPPTYVHIKRNVYLVKKKRDALYVDVGCTNCRIKCDEGCVCRVQCISCSKACRCSDACTNRPFRKDRKIKMVKTEHCGWGVEAAENISKGDFIIEYIGEVINDAICEQRLWGMKFTGVKNFYMCEIHKDFIIDATLKGNTSRFLNHSCEPNCKLEKWQVEGETRVGVFAAQSIKAGEPLTYDYRFVQFGPEVNCYCGSAKCHGYLGTKRNDCSSSKSHGKRSVNQKTGLGDIRWGLKRKRTTDTCITILRSCLDAVPVPCDSMV